MIYQTARTSVYSVKLEAIKVLLARSLALNPLVVVGGGGRIRILSRQPPRHQGTYQKSLATFKYVRELRNRPSS